MPIPVGSLTGGPAGLPPGGVFLLLSWILDMTLRAVLPGPVGLDLPARVRAPAIPTSILGPIVGSIDFLIFSSAFLAAVALRDGNAPGPVDLSGRVPLLALLMIGGLASQGAYDFRRVHGVPDLLTRIWVGGLLGLACLVLFSYVLPDLAVTRGVLGLAAALALPAILAWRHSLFRLLCRSKLRPHAVVLGEIEVAAPIASALQFAPFGGAEVAGILVPERRDAWEAGRDHGNRFDRLSSPDGSPDGVPVLGDYAQLAAVAAQHDLSLAVIAAGSRDEHLPLPAILGLRQRGLQVEDGLAAYEAVTGRVLLEELPPGHIVFSHAFDPTRLGSKLHRLLEILAASVLLLLFFPFLILVGIAIRLESPGPALFLQSRVGRGGRTFGLVKFRTMVQDAEARTGPVWTLERDPRVTRLGRFLRRTRIDELPQLWNVLAGDMAFIGPRPERPEFVATLAKRIPYYDQRHTVRPGITGWAQIHYRYGASIEEAAIKLQYDLYYIQHQCLWLQIEVLIGTLRVVFGAGNRH